MTDLAIRSEVLPVGQLTLFDLATIANEQHELALHAGLKMLEHAFRAGEALIAAKERLRHGEWLPWLAVNFDASERTAQRYMEVASNPTRVADLEEPSLRRALEAIAAAEGGVHPTMRVMGSSESDLWGTPQDLFDRLDDEFGFALDVCATPELAKCARYFTPEQDGLAQDWHGVCWMNPPYGETIPRWIAKAHLSAREGATVVCLVPARVDTAWWWDHCRHAEIRFIRGRLRFGNGEQSAPFPSAVVIFGRAARVVWWERL